MSVRSNGGGHDHHADHGDGTDRNDSANRDDRTTDAGRPTHLRPGLRPRPLPRRTTLRARVTVVASLGITVAIVLGLLLFYLLQVNSLHSTVDSQLRTYATQIEQSAVDGSFPKPLPPSTLDPSAEAQVVAADGTVIAATRNLAGLPAVFTLAAGSETPVRQKAADGVVPSEVRVVGARAMVGGQPVSVITGTPTSLLRQSNSEFLKHLVLGLPVILGLAAAAVWLVVGRALRPVERIRLAVTDITSADLARRVPEPGTPDEVGHLAQTMNDMLARLEDSSLRQRRFVADASHELRSPLAALRTTLEVGLAHPDKAPWPVIAERARKQTGRLEDLIQQLLLLAKADERQLAAQRQRIDLSALLKEVAAEASAGARAGASALSHVEIAVGAPDGLAVLGNRDHVQRVFRNVVENAMRYARSRVVIAASAADGRVRVVIDDDGPGIPAADRDRVFDRFVRLDDSRERGSGTSGLGLAIAREIVLAHDGRITVGVSPSGGAQLVVTLPPADASST